MKAIELALSPKDCCCKIANAHLMQTERLHSGLGTTWPVLTRESQ